MCRYRASARAKVSIRWTMTVAGASRPAQFMSIRVAPRCCTSLAVLFCAIDPHAAARCPDRGRCCASQSTLLGNAIAGLSVCKAAIEPGRTDKKGRNGWLRPEHVWPPD